MHAAPSGGVTGAIGDIASEAARRFGAKTAYTVVMPNGMYGKLTFEDVDRLSDDFAVYLRERCGLAAGDRVALQTPNCLAFPVAALGILKAGCVLVNTNPLYTADEMERQFADAGISAIVIVDMFADKLADVASRMPLKHIIVSSVSEFMPRAVGGVIRLVQRFWDRSLPPVTIPHERFAAALREGGEIRKARGVTVSGYTAGMGPDALACLQYTGGTTGVSKGAMLTHGNILANIAQGETCFAGNMRPGEEVMLTALPLYHILAFTANFLMFHKAGANNILIPNPRPISNLKRAFENHNITWMTGVNTLFNALNNEFWFAESPPKTLRGAVAGGMALQQAVAERFKAITGADVFEGYGLTETSPIVTFNAPGKARPGSIGLPMGATEVALFDDEGRSVPDGEPGELAVKGPQVMKGYWNKPEETAKAIRAGWFLTGDIATRDADGYLRIVDRKKDMILVSGFNVYPNEVEDVIARHPGVLECAVIGMPDGASGEAVAAYVVPRDGSLTADALREHCKAHLTGYKTPRSVTFRETLPKSNVGKILRKDLRAEVLAGK
ncbi:MAG: AMP-binding protein [Methylocystis sp.]|nr:AMP-binding protein [Methylocystis sp.]MCA3582303.1 AMP-binding protein [Methylocystis sp.]MCA3588198.1 AMP-binding protein [Methylocystis sp.]MCA3590116.1 AMP-binding protein [Methylocystis sp.]